MVLYRRSSGPVFWEFKQCSGEWHSTLPHSHAEWSVGLVESGLCELTSCGQNVTVVAPALVWFSPETVHECRPIRTQDWAFRMVYWRAPCATGDWGFRTITEEDAQEWSRFFDDLAETGRGDRAPNWLLSRGFGVPAPQTTEPILTPRPVSRGTRPDRPYKQRYGLAPIRHRTVLRLRWAQELLRRGHAPSEAAFEAGFYDQSQFTRAFRAFAGTTPGRFLHS